MRKDAGLSAFSRVDTGKGTGISTDMCAVKLGLVQIISTYCLLERIADYVSFC